MTASESIAKVRIKDALFRTVLVAFGLGAAAGAVAGWAHLKRHLTSPLAAIGHVQAPAPAPQVIEHAPVPAAAPQAEPAPPAPASAEAPSRATADMLGELARVFDESDEDPAESRAMRDLLERLDDLVGRSVELNEALLKLPLARPAGAQVPPQEPQ